MGFKEPARFLLYFGLVLLRLSTIVKVVGTLGVSVAIGHDMIENIIQRKIGL